MNPGDGDHLETLIGALRRFRCHAATVEAWGVTSPPSSVPGAVVGVRERGSAAQAQHLTAELVGRYRADRRPYAAIPLHADTSSTTAICNDYGPDEVFAWQVRAYARPSRPSVLMVPGHGRAGGRSVEAPRGYRRG